MKRSARSSPLQDVRPPRLSPRLRAVVKAQLALVPSQAEQVTQAIREAISDYDNTRDASVIDDLRRTVEFNLHLWYQTLLKGKALTPETLGEAMASAQRRVRQSISLAALLRAYRIGSLSYLNFLLNAVREQPQLHREMLFAVSPFLLYYLDVVAQTVSASYHNEQNRQTRWQDRLRHELCAVIFNHPQNAEGFRSQAQALGLDPVAPHTALALQLDDPLSTLSEFDERLESLMAAVPRLLRFDRDKCLHAVRNGHVLYWLPMPRGETQVSHEQRLARQATAILEGGLREIQAVGLGLSGSGASGWQLSAQQAIKAIELGTRLQPGRVVRRYTEVALDDAVMVSEETARYFDALLERLYTEVGLVETLSVYFDLGQHRKAVAARLGVHPNTLDYRLNRIEMLLGAPLSDTGWVVKLHTALRLRRLRPTRSS